VGGDEVAVLLGLHEDHRLLGADIAQDVYQLLALLELRHLVEGLLDVLVGGSDLGPI
jgi:hypothetical protein